MNKKFHSVFKVAPDFPDDDEGFAIINGICILKDTSETMTAGRFLDTSVFDKFQFAGVQDGKAAPVLPNSLGWFLLREDIAHQVEELPLSKYLQLLEFPVSDVRSLAFDTPARFRYLYMNVLTVIHCIDRETSQLTIATNDIGFPYILSVKYAEMKISSKELSNKEIDWLVFRAIDFLIR